MGDMMAACACCCAVHGWRLLDGLFGALAAGVIGTIIIKPRRMGLERVDAHAGAYGIQADAALMYLVL
ncbi:MAG: hypothetical protein ACLUEQ_04030 [Cloacibacillus evryensis]